MAMSFKESMIKLIGNRLNVLLIGKLNLTTYIDINEEICFLQSIIDLGDAHSEYEAVTMLNEEGLAKFKGCQQDLNLRKFDEE
jgi:hypothetical protein